MTPVLPMFHNVCVSVTCIRELYTGTRKPAEMPSRVGARNHELCSARTNLLLVPSVNLSTVGGRAFPVAGPTIWNSLPDNVISAPSLSTFRQRLQHFCSRPRSLTSSLIPGKLFPTSSGFWSDFITWTTLKCMIDRGPD